MSSLRVVLVGCQGQGKTTFFNLICGQNEKTQKHGSSCTRGIVQGFSQSGFGFEVIDTPGFNVREDRLTHAAGILAGLSFGKVDQILVVIKLDRDDDMLDKLSIIYKPLRRFTKLFTIIVTHWDECQLDKQQEKERIETLIFKSFQIKSILFLSKNDKYQDINQKIDKILLENQQNKQNSEQIKLLESEVYRYFEFIDMDDQIYADMDYDSEELQRKFRKIAKCYNSFISKLSNENPNFLDILHALNLKIKEEATHQVEIFEKLYADRILELQDKNNNKISYLHYIFLKKALTMEVEKVIQTINQKIKEQQLSVFQYLKQCPNCKLIWLKVAGCDMQTTCGNRVLPCDFDVFENLAVQNKVKIQRDENEDEIKFEIKEPIYLQNEEIKKFILENLFLDELLKKQLNFQSQEQLFDLLNQCLGVDFHNQYANSINDCNKQYFLSWFKANLQQYLGQYLQYNYEIDIQKGVGCGYPIIWNMLPPLDQSILKELEAPELYDYFADQELLIKDEAQWLDKTYKNIIDGAIEKQKQEIKILNKKNQNQEQQID